MICAFAHTRLKMASPLAFATLAAFIGSSVDAAPTQFAALEGRLSDALAAYDARAVDRLWDDKFVFVFPNGG